MRAQFTILMLICLSICSYSQLEYQDSVRQKLTFQFNADAFLKNNEYFNPYTEGFTGIGIILQPKLHFQIDKRTSISLGYHFLKFSGLNNFSEAIPLFQIDTEFTQDIHLIIGQLQGGRLHKLSEPLYRIDNDYQNQIEYGLQLLILKDWLRSDVWLHWDQFIKKDDPFPEEIYAGSTQRLTVLNRHKFGLDLSAELLISHLGGQIDAADNPDRTILNYSFGPTFTYKLTAQSIFSAECLFYKSSVVKQVADTQSQYFIPFESGNAWYSRLQLSVPSIDVKLGYWSGTGFISPIGESLFLSVSDFDPDFTEEHRKLLTTHVEYAASMFDYLSIYAQSGLYYDTATNHLDYMYGLRFLLQLGFKLK